MRIARVVMGGAVVALASASAGAQQRAALVVGPRLASKEALSYDSTGEASLYLPAAQGSQESPTARPFNIRGPASAAASQNDGGAGRFKSGAGGALVDGIAAGGFVFSVAHFIDSDSAVKAGLIGGAVVFVGELVWNKIRSHSDEP